MHFTSIPLPTMASGGADLFHLLSIWPRVWGVCVSFWGVFLIFSGPLKTLTWIKLENQWFMFPLPTLTEFWVYLFHYFLSCGFYPLIFYKPKVLAVFALLGCWLDFTWIFCICPMYWISLFPKHLCLDSHSFWVLPGAVELRCDIRAYTWVW